MNETAAALNESAQNATQKTPATPEGMAMAYGSLVIMALLPIFFGSFRSVKYHKEQKVGTACLWLCRCRLPACDRSAPYGLLSNGMYQATFVTK